MHNVIFMKLQEMGFKSNHLGYKYIRDLLYKCLNGENILPLKQNGYKCISLKYGKSVVSIEKDIQNAISSAWIYGNIDILYAIFQSTIDIDKGKPTNKQFILTIADLLTS
ncbi:MAG: sporulation initiation factor Spo0A C-terminal domain-containing protein [Clostridia bacterium]|nr:sporulation initiation factor Spo0A C-terminal domain-containing protein [Clostridia bacterium]